MGAEAVHMKAQGLKVELCSESGSIMDWLQRILKFLQVQDAGGSLDLQAFSFS